MFKFNNNDDQYIDEGELERLQEEASYTLIDALEGKNEGSKEWIEKLLFDVSRANRRETRKPAAHEKRFAVYARYSRSIQKQSSIERQNSICQLYLDVFGGTAVAFFADRGKSGANAAGRSGLMKLLSRLDEFDAIVVEDFDRFSREIYDAMEIAEKLEKAGVELHSAIDERLMTKEDINQAAAFAERDRVRRRNLTSAGLSQLVAAGGVPSGACYGYKTGDRPGFPEVDEDQRLVVIKLMKLASEKTTYAEIARQLTEDGDIAPNGKTTWNSSGVNAIVRRPLYTGRIFYRRFSAYKDRKTLKISLYQNSKERVEYNYAERYRIVSDELFRKANEARRRKGRPTKRDAADRAAQLFGHTVCDCPGAVGQRFHTGDKLAGRMVCNLATKRASCHAHIQSFEIEPVERTILKTLVENSSHSFSQQEFENFYKERISEQKKLLDARKASAEYELANELDVRDRTFRKDLIAGASGAAVLEMRRQTEKQIEDLHDLLAKVTRARAALDGREDFLPTIPRAFRALDLRLPFRVRNESDADFLTMFRKLVPEVRIERHDRPRGDVTVFMKVVWDALLTDDDASIAEAESVWLQTDMVQDIKYGLNESAQLSMEELASRGIHRLTDEQWSLVREVLPDTRFTDHHGKRNTPTRTVVDALIFKLTTRIPLSRLPKFFGERKPIYSAILRFAYAGGIEKLQKTLGEYHPDLVASWDLKSVAKLARAEQVASVPRVVERPALVAERNIVSGSHRLTEEQWLAVQPAIDDTVAKPTGRRNCVIPDRTILELILLKLRTRCAWRKVPLGSFAYDDFYGAVMRIAYSGSWDNVSAILRRDFPEVLDGVDTKHMENKLRSRRLESADAQGIVRKPEGGPMRRIWDAHGPCRRVMAEDWVDITDREWALVAEVLPPLSRRRHRRSVDAILFLMSTRTPWQKLPKKYGSGSSVYKVFQKFAQEDQDGSSIIRSIVTVLEANSPQTLARMGRTGTFASTAPTALPPLERLEIGYGKDRRPSTKAKRKRFDDAVPRSGEDASASGQVSDQFDLFV